MIKTAIAFLFATALAAMAQDVLLLKNGDRRAIVQAKASEILAAGDAVTIVTTGSKVRVTKNK